MARKIAVIGNCQVSGIASALRTLLPGDEIAAWHVGTTHANKETILAELPKFDFIVSNLKDGEQGREFDRRFLRDRAQNVVFLSPVAFTGFHPDCVYIGHGGRLIPGVVGPYHSAIIAACYALELPTERVPRLFNSLVYAKLGYFDAFIAAKQAFLKEHAADGYDLGIHFERWMAAGCFMYTINHPRIAVSSTLATLAAVRAGLLPSGTPVPDAVIDDLEQHEQWPTYPEIARRLRLTGSMGFRRSSFDLSPGQDRQIDLEEAIAANYHIYDDVPGLTLSAGRVGFVRRRLDELLRPIREKRARPDQQQTPPQVASFRPQEDARPVAEAEAATTVEGSPQTARASFVTPGSAAQRAAASLAQCGVVRIDSPDEAFSWLNAGEAYRDAGRLDRAEQVFTQAVDLFPEEMWIAHGHAVVAQRRADWTEALRRANRVCGKFPNHPIGYTLKGESLRNLGRLDEAEAAYGEATSRFPQDEWALRGYATLASDRRSWSEAAARWRAVLQPYPDLVPARIRLAEALIEVDRQGEAEPILAEILQREPENTEALGLRSMLIDRRSPQEDVVQEIRERDIRAELQGWVVNPEVFIEITSICNFSCSYCVSPMKLREKKQMSMDTFRQVVEQVAPLTKRAVRLHIDGEPTSHPRFREMALLVNSYGLPISLATNGSHLDPSLLDIWMDPLISMSTSPEELVIRHNKLNFDNYIECIANYAAAWSRSESRQNLFFQIIHYPQESPAATRAYQERKDAFLVEFCKRANLYDACSEETSVNEESYRLVRKTQPRSLTFIKQVVSSGGLYPLDGKMVQRERATAGFCDSPWRQLVVHSNGSLGACCVDLSGGTTFATADEVEGRSIKELWDASPQIQRMRQAFLEGRIERDVCQRCLQQGQVISLPSGQ